MRAAEEHAILAIKYILIQHYFKNVLKVLLKSSYSIVCVSCTPVVYAERDRRFRDRNWCPVVTKRLVIEIRTGDYPVIGPSIDACRPRAFRCCGLNG